LTTQTSYRRVLGLAVMLAAILSTAPAVHAAAIISPINIYSTGEPSSQGTQTVDTHWSLISSPGVYPDTSSTLYVVDASGFPFNGSWAADYGPAARWIAPQPSYTYHQSDVAGDFVYATSFTISDPHADLSTALLWGEVSSDNCTAELYVNGVATGFNMQTLSPGSKCIKTHYSFELGGSSMVFQTAAGTFSTHVNFLAGLNTIAFKVSNYTCAIADGCTQNPTGIIVKLQGSVDEPAPVPEPATAGLAGLALTAVAFVQRHRWA
jgi:hypothetical protein